MKKMKLVMVGNGMAGVRTLEELLKIEPDLYDISVFGAEPHPNYNRILLSPVLAGEQTLDEIVLNPLSWYADNHITLHLGKKVVDVNRSRRTVIAEDGTEEAYDRLLLATGSNPFILPVPGKDLDGVIAYRDISDTNTMIAAAEKYRHAVVIGGGLLGLEAANGLMLRGMQVTVVHIMPWLMERQLDEVAGKLLQRSLEDRGLKFMIGAQTAALVGTADDHPEGAPAPRPRVRFVRFKDGSEVPADLVVMAAGIRPNTALAEKIGLHCNKGIVVNDTMQTITDPRIYSVGECAAHRGIAYGLVAPLFEQGKVCATHLGQFGIGRYQGSQTSTKLKVTGIDLFSAGNFTGKASGKTEDADCEEIVMSDPYCGVYKKLVIKDDKLIGAQTQALIPDKAGRVMAVKFKDGPETPADLVVMAAGIRPNTQLAEAAGIHCVRGIVVNDTLQTITDPRIYAVGECAAHRGIAYGLVAPLFEQGKVCATHLAQFGIGRYTGSQTSTKLKVTGIDLFSAGNFSGGPGTEEIVLSDPYAGVYKKLVIQGDKLVGACLYGDTVDGSWYFKLLRDGRAIGDLRDKLMFGESNIGDVGHQGQSRAMAMQDLDEVCGCNGINKGTICKAIKDKGLFTLEEVRKHTKASASCGSCTGLVEQLLMFTAGGDYSKAPTKKAMCGCTDASHDDARKAIRQDKLLTIDGVYSALNWRTPNGCASCRPAINYYLLSSWPKEAKDDPQSRYINERSHANIQKDGTYSVIPRMWGGETTADELRRIANAVDKYKIPTVKVTGGQRIDLLGVKKEDLVGVWKDIAMPSGHAYAKALRTVKTCVGSEWCRFGTQDSTQMGKDLERALWRMYAPHKVKLAVSGCPRNCAESGIKDVGVIGVDSGWEDRKSVV